MKENTERFTLKDIYGSRTYHKFIETGEQYHYAFSSDCPEFRLGGKNYMIITITGIRSGVAFYTVENHPEKEFFFAIRSAMGAFLEPFYLPDEYVKLLESVNKARLNGYGYLPFE